MWPSLSSTSRCQVPSGHCMMNADGLSDVPSYSYVRINLTTPFVPYVVRVLWRPSSSYVASQPLVITPSLS